MQTELDTFYTNFSNIESVGSELLPTDLNSDNKIT